MNEELILYYVNLLILQYKVKSKANLTTAAIVESSMIYDLIREVENGYNLDTAIGAQLDVLAKYVSATRIVAVNLPLERDYWGVVDYDEVPPFTGVAGVVDYTQDPIPDADLLLYDTDLNSSFALSDQELRTIIKLKIIQNNSNHSDKDIDDLINDFFGDNVIFQDQFDMSIDYIFDQQASQLAFIAFEIGALPKPMGVKINLSIVPDIENIFGMLDYNNTMTPSFIEGFLDYTDTPVGGWLTY